MTTLSANVCRVKRSFKPYQNEHVSRRPEKKAKNHVMLTWKLLWKSFSTTHLPFLYLIYPKILKAFQKTFPTKMKLTKCLAAEKKMRHWKRKESGGEKAKSKSQDCCITFKPQNSLKILLSMHAPTLHTSLVYYIWIRRPWRVWPVNSFVESS